MKNLYLDILANSPIGPITIASTDKGVLVIEIGRDISAWDDSFRRIGFEPVRSGGYAAREQLEAYFAGKRHEFELPIDDLLMTPFQKIVLHAVARVPYGKTSTYSAIAGEIGNPKAVRAVGRANATNPLTIVMPCHRLVGVDGTLRGYRAPDGIRTKAWLIEFERRNRLISAALSPGV